jgi:prepilin-type N-terminal cleavage/methylation domain-containing protein
MSKPVYNNPRNDAGFTLAELLVASMLLTIVMSGVYLCFSSTVRLWRLGEENIQTYQDGRTALSIMTRELQNIIPGTAYLAEGSNDEFTFFAVAPPLDVDENSDPQVIQIQYRTRKDPNGKGDILLREERLVKSPLPSKPPGEGEIDRTIIKMASEKDFELAYAVEDFEIRYYWLPPEKGVPDATDTGLPPSAEFVVRDEHPKGSGIPQGMRIDLTLLDENAESSETTFTTFVVFRGPTTALEDDSIEKDGGFL